MHNRKPAIIHRDLKPSNIMISPDGTVKLLDFNAAKVENAAQNRDTVLLGTAGFAAPEQYGFAASSPQTDIYAMGVLINVMLTGALPYEKLAAGKARRPILRCLEVNPRDRYHDIKELYQALKRAGRVHAEWLLPGFRTMRIPNMLTAAAVYTLLILGTVNLNPSPMPNVGERNSFRLCFLSACLLSIFFFCDYLGLRRMFPFMRSRRKGLRVLGIILAPFLIVWMVLIIHVAFVVIFL